MPDSEAPLENGFSGEKATSPPQCARRKRPALVRLTVMTLVVAVTIVLVFPPIQVTYVAFVNPSTTGPIILRKLQSIVFGLNLSPADLHWRDMEEVPEFFLRCVWQMEDAKFFQHKGFDWEQIQRARTLAARTGKPTAGASTITQQCARSLFLWQARSWTRKGLEAYYTTWMELLLSKRRILELYANVIEFGDGIYGIEAAAQFYCAKPARELTKKECAILSAILPRPLKWKPWKPDRVILARRTIALERGARVKLPPGIKDH